MNKVLRIISIVLLGAAAAAMFLFYTPLIDGKSPAAFVLGSEIVVYALGGLLLLSGILCFRSFGFKNKRVFRIIIGAIVIGLVVATKVLPNTPISIGPVTIYLSYLIFGLGYFVVFLLLFILHLAELGSRKGVSKIFPPFADLILMVFALALYASLAVPMITQLPFYSYIELGLKYVHYGVGGFLAATFLFAVIELFIRKPAQ